MNDFLQGIVMLFGIVAVIVAVLAEQRRLHARPSQTCRTSAPKRSPIARRVREHVRPRSVQPARRGGADAASARGACRKWCRSSTPSKAAPPLSRAPSSPRCSPSSSPAAATSWAASDACTRGQIEMRAARHARVRLHHPHHAVHPARFAHRPRHRARAFRLDVDACARWCSPRRARSRST